MAVSVQTPGGQQGPDTSDLFRAIAPCGLVKLPLSRVWAADTIAQQRIIVWDPDVIAFSDPNSDLASCIKTHAADLVKSDAAWWAAFGHNAAQIGMGVALAVAVGALVTTASVHIYNHREAYRATTSAAASKAGAALQRAGRGLVAIMPGWCAHRLQATLTPWEADAPPSAATELV